jgi:putative hydrolase of the HAD superfamily
MAYRAVLFDVGDTLWHSAAAPPPSEFRRIAAERAERFLRGAKLPAGDAAAVSRLAWDTLEDAMRLARETDRIEPDYAAVVRDALAADGLALSREQAAGLLDAIYISGEEGGKAAFPGARGVLEALLARGFRLGIVTNRAFGGERFAEDLRAAGLDVAWESIVTSVEVGYLKPHSKIFCKSLGELGLAPAEVVMVGNSLAEDVAGAQAVGIAAAWKRSRPDAEGVTPDFAFDELAELLEWDALRGAARG